MSGNIVGKDIWLHENLRFKYVQNNFPVVLVSKLGVRSQIKYYVLFDFSFNPGDLNQIVLIKGLAVFAPLFFDFPDEHALRVTIILKKHNIRTSLQMEKPQKISVYTP